MLFRSQKYTQILLSTPGRQGGQERDGSLKTLLPGHIRQGSFYPDPVVTEYPVTSTGIYVQAGSFTQAGNARTLSMNLAGYKKSAVYPAMINGTRYYRVRLGPMASVEEADELLARLIESGHSQAIIVVE